MADRPIRQRVVVPFGGHRIGEGVNCDVGERVGMGLAAGTMGEDPIADGQSARFRFQMVTSQQSLEDALNIGAEIEARYGLFSGGGKFSFAERNATNRSSTYVVASCVVQNALRAGTDFRPTDAASRLLAAGDTEGFKRAFGDRFVQALRTGGEFYALVRITSSNTEHQRKIGASLHAELNGLVAAGSFKASLDIAHSDASSHTQVDIDVEQTGGQGNQLQLPGTEADKIRDHMNGFAASVHAHPQAYEAELLTYDALALAMPTPMEQEDKRRVLEDCLERKRRYWSAISELDFLQTEDAQLIFAGLPAREELAGLQNAFRAVLNALMAHARDVSIGAIPPSLFVPASEPILPRAARRNATTFAVWWARRNDPNVLQDEQTLIRKIGRAAASLLATPLEEAPAAAVEAAVGRLDELDLAFNQSFESTPPLRSLQSLPLMLTAPLRSLQLQRNELDDLRGIEAVSRLESLNVEQNQLRDIVALAEVPGLKVLNATRNKIADLGPLRSMTSLETLQIAGNEIASLEPLRDVPSLSMLILGQELVNFSSDPNPPKVHLGNPVTDASGLAGLPLVTNPFILADRVSLRLTDLGDDLGDAAGLVLDRLAAGEPAGAVSEGVATRVGTSNRFTLSLAAGGAEEPLILIACGRTAGAVPRRLMAVLLPTRKKVAVGYLPDGSPAASLSTRELAQAMVAERMSLLGLALMGLPPEILLEAQVA